MKALSLTPIIGINVRPEELRAASILLAGVVLTIIHRQACGVDVLPVTGILSAETARVWLYCACTLVLFAIIPMLIVQRGFRAPLAEYGVQIGEWKFGLTAVAVLVPIIAVAMLLPAAQMEDMRAVYPVDKGAMDSVPMFLQYAVGRVFLFYVAWEFFFRGFLLFGIRKSVGDTMAIAITTLPSALWHIGYPTGELYASIAAGLLFGWLAIRTRSILWPLLLHASIGLITDLCITLSQ
jgi:membrane protease YdiL (CAAX protease family)